MVKPHINFTVLCVRKTESCPSSPLRLQSSGYKASLRCVSFQRGETTHARTQTSVTPITRYHHCFRNKLSLCKQTIVAYLTHSYITQERLEIQPNMKHVEVCTRFIFLHVTRLKSVVGVTIRPPYSCGTATCIHFIHGYRKHCGFFGGDTNESPRWASNFDS